MVIGRPAVRTPTTNYAGRTRNRVVQTAIHSFIHSLLMPTAVLDDGSSASVILPVCPLDKKTNIAKLGTEIVHHDTAPIN